MKTETEMKLKRLKKFELDRIDRMDLIIFKVSGLPVVSIQHGHREGTMGPASACGRHAEIETGRMGREYTPQAWRPY